MTQLSNDPSARPNTVPAPSQAEASLPLAWRASRGDQNSPENRWHRYQDRRVKNSADRLFNVMIFVFYCAEVINELSGYLTADSVWVIAPFVITCLLSMDLFVYVCRRIEDWWFRPSYDKASQAKPPTTVPQGGIGPGRMLLYIVLTPCLPTIAILLSSHFAILDRMPWPQPLFSASKLMFFLLLTKADPRGIWPGSMREFLAPFKRIPSPDIN